MKISVIIPVFNCAGYLDAVIDSILRSGLDVCEIITVNDGSTDDTGLVLQKLSDRFPIIKVVEQENKGVSSARNKGIQEAKGDYLLFVDADDSLEEGSLAEANGILEAEHPDMLLFGMWFDYYHHGRLYRSDEIVFPKCGSMDKEEARNIFEELFQHNMLSPVWNKLIRRELLTANGISFMENMIEMEDYLFSVRCLSECSKIYVMNRAAYHYRQAENERGTYNRLWRIDSLSGYIEPFYEAAEWLGSFAGGQEKALCVADRIYSMLFHEQLRFASLGRIRIAAKDMLSGAHSGAIEAADPGLYGKLKNKRYACVWLRCISGRARHWAAVKLKHLKNAKGEGK